MLDLRRFARLAAAEWVENRRAWAWFLGVVVVLHFVLVLALLAAENGHRSFDLEDQSVFFFSGLFLTGPVFAGRYFQAMARPGSALVALMRPASTLEKWLLAVLVVGIGYPLAYHLVFYICDVPAVLFAADRAAVDLATQLANPGKANTEWLGESLDPDNFRIFTLGRSGIDVGSFVLLGLAFTALQAFALTGVLVFRRLPFLKTLLAGFVVLLACLLMESVFGSDPGAFFDYWREINEDYPTLTAAQRMVFPAVWIGVPALLWLSAFLALREREIA